MAIWQISFFITPESGISWHLMAKINEENLFDDSDTWLKEQISPNFFESIDAILPKSISWCNKISLFGAENGNRLEVLENDQIVESVSLRIDFTSDYEDVLRQIIEFCALNGLRIVSSNFEILPLNFEAINYVIRNAPQVKKYVELLNATKGK
jgi:hypothetical protein